MVFKYQKNWQEDFFLQIFFPFRYSKEVIVERMADSSHPKSFSELFSMGG
jgi:hypothetical protein